MIEASTQSGATHAASGPHRESLWLVALYETEERIHELLARLHALGVETEEASIVRVELNDQIRAAGTTPLAPPLSVRQRNAISGAIAGSAILLLAGLGLYEAGLLQLSGVQGLSAHALLFVVAGAALGALIGALLKPPKPRAQAGSRSQAAAPFSPDNPAALSDLTSDGYLVAVKMPPHLGEQAEAIARGLGAKQILL